MIPKTSFSLGKNKSKDGGYFGFFRSPERLVLASRPEDLGGSVASNDGNCRPKMPF